MAIFEDRFDTDTRPEEVCPNTRKSARTKGAAAYIMLMATLCLLPGIFAYHYFQFRPQDADEYASAQAQQFYAYPESSPVPQHRAHAQHIENHKYAGGLEHLRAPDAAPPAHDGGTSVPVQAHTSMAETDIAIGEHNTHSASPRFTLTADRFLFGDAMFYMASGAATTTTETAVCQEARVRVRNAALKQGVSPDALSVEAIRSETGQAVPVTRFSAYLPETLTADALHQAVSDAVADMDLWTDMLTLSSERRLIQVHYHDILCVELLCTSATMLLTPVKPPPEAIAPSAAQDDIERQEEALMREHALPDDPAHPDDGAEALAGEEEHVRPDRATYLAIILDDGGYGGPDTARILALDNRLTLAILPDTPFIRQTAEDAAALGFEIMLHMPMQTGRNGRNTFPGELDLTMTREEIHARTLECIAQLPQAVGVNNHTGAAFTEDEEKIRWFLEVVKDQGIYFVDSRTTAGSRAYDVAVELGIPSANRDIFLDNSNDPDEIREQLKALIQLSRSRGAAVGIGHFRRNTVDVLEEELPKLEAMGIILTHVSELLR